MPKSLDLEYDKYSGKTTLINIDDANSSSLAFIYNNLGERVYKEANLQDGIYRTAYIRGLSDRTLMEVDEVGNTTSYVYSSTGLISKISDEEFYIVKDHLGSTREVFNSQGVNVTSYNYDAFGNLMDSVVSEDISYQYTGQEFDDEIELHNFQARFYDSDLMRFMSVDPEEQYASPYLFCGNNPINLIDPDGRSAIYDPYGTLLGTDDFGLQGDPIFMDVDNFDQGMSYDEAIEFNLGYGGLENQDAIDKFTTSFLGLPDRPDWDGYLTLEEANDWYRNGDGQPLFVALDKIDLSNLYSLGEEFVGQKKVVNFIFGSKSWNDGLVYGNVRLIRHPNHSVKAVSGDVYDFDMHSGKTLKTWGRNIETKIAEKIAGKGTAYKIHMYGDKKLKPRYWWVK